MNDAPAKATAKSRIGLAVLVLPLLLITIPLDLTPDLAERVSSTMAEARLVAAEVGGSTGDSILEASAAGFSDAITVTGLAGAGVMVRTAIWALVTLRSATAHQDLAAVAEHDLELVH